MESNVELSTVKSATRAMAHVPHRRMIDDDDGNCGRDCKSQTQSATQQNDAWLTCYRWCAKLLLLVIIMVAIVTALGSKMAPILSPLLPKPPSPPAPVQPPWVLPPYPALPSRLPPSPSLIAPPLSSPPPRPLSPLQPPSLPSRLAVINDRYALGQPSNDLAQAGVFVTMIDSVVAPPSNGHPANWPPPWVPTVHGGVVDRVSGSIINRDMIGIFDLPVGLILRPKCAQRCLMCSYRGDAGSNGPMPCRIGAFPPERLEEMLRGPQGNVHGIYNEVILRDHDECYSSQMPDIVEAIFARDSNHLYEARGAYELFTRHFELDRSPERPLLPPLLLFYRPGEGFGFDPASILVAPPPLPPPFGRRTSIELVAAINDRFASGHPSNKVERAGVFVRGLDQLTRDGLLPWASYWPHSSEPADRTSGCIANGRLPYIYMRTPWGESRFDDSPPGPQVGAGGYILSSSAVDLALLCSYPRDAATTNDRSPSRGCVREGVFAMSHLRGMLQAHEARAAACREAGNVNNCYNEVLLDPSLLEGLLPQAIEAFTYPIGGSGCPARGEAASARHMFLEHFPSVHPATLPLVSFDRTRARPFELVCWTYVCS